jgi:hypothetical protein
MYPNVLNALVLFCKFLVSFFFFFGSSGVWTRALCVLGRCSTTWTIPPPLSALIIIQIVSQVLWPPWPEPWSFYLCFSCSWNDRHKIPYPTYWLRSGCLTNFFTELASNHDPPDLCLLSNQDYRCEPPCPAHFLYITK